MTAAPRSALLAGATGLVGSALLPRLLAGNHYRRVHVLSRRGIPGLVPDHKLEVHVVDFAALPTPFPGSDDAFIALGTTIGAAGSQAAFRRVDLDFVVATARAARLAGATRLAVVSALGADAASRVFYNRVKGEMEQAVAALGYESVVIARPSLLLGDRAALGQPARAGEGWAQRLARPFGWIVPRGVRPIQAGDVAAALVTAMRDPKPGVTLLPSGAMQPPAGAY